MLPYNLKHTAAAILNVGADSISARHCDTISFAEMVIYALANLTKTPKVFEGFQETFFKKFPEWGPG